jgi:hypothetical protein
MNFNLIPLLISISGAVLVVLVQHLLRLYLHPSGLLAIFLGSAPNLLIGFWFPFSILLRPRVFTKAAYGWLFPLWCLGTLLVLCWFEVAMPFKGAQTFDYFDILASFVGVMLATLFYYRWLQSKLVFGAEES